MILLIYPFHINATYVSPSGSCVKPVDEGAADITTLSTPFKHQSQGHQASTGEVNGFISPSEEAPPAPPQNTVTDQPALLLKTPPTNTKYTPLERPVSLQVGQHPEKPAISSTDMTQPQPQAKGEHQACVTTNDLSLDSTETSVFSPSSLSDSDLLEAVLDGTSSPVPEKLMPEKPADINVNVQIKENPLPNKDINVTQIAESNLIEYGTDETSSKISLLTETVRQEKGQKERECVIARTSDQDEVVSHKHSEPKSNVSSLSEGIEGCDVPDGRKSEDLPSVSEAVPPSLKPEPKKQQSFFKRNRKKSNQGNLSINLNKDHVWNASLLACFKGKSLFVLFALHFTFYVLYMGYFSVCS